MYTVQVNNARISAYLNYTRHVSLHSGDAVSEHMAQLRF
jgi:hypothetical protein